MGENTKRPVLMVRILPMGEEKKGLLVNLVNTYLTLDHWLMMRISLINIMRKQVIENKRERVERRGRRRGGWVKGGRGGRNKGGIYI